MKLFGNLFKEFVYLCVFRVLFMDDDKPVKWCHCLLELERETGIHGKQSNILFVVSKVRSGTNQRPVFRSRDLSGPIRGPIFSNKKA